MSIRNSTFSINSAPIKRRVIMHHDAVRSFKKNWDLYLILIPIIAYFVIFQYWPMYGVQIAFKNFTAAKGIWGSQWVGVHHFERFFDSYYFWRLILNTLGISVYHLIIGFPVPIILALMINEIQNSFFKKTVQLVTYMPHFLSVVIVVGMLSLFLSPQYGFVNTIIKYFGGEPVFFMAEPKWFKTLYVFSGVWQNMGWGSIIYIAAIAGIDTQLYEAAIVDGASKLQRIIHITIPGILPTVIILLILNVGQIMHVGFEKVFLMQNSLNKEASDVISTYVYSKGLLGAQYSFAAAVGMFNSIINFILLITVNRISRKVSETSLW